MAEFTCPKCGKETPSLIRGWCVDCNRAWRLKNRAKPFVGYCKLCRKEIKGKTGTFLAGIGSCHQKCVEEKEKFGRVLL